MFRQTIENLKQNIIDSNGIGENLYDKNEFKQLTKYIFEDEILDSVMVSQVEGEIYLVGFTNRRLFLIKKESFVESYVKRKGLEEVKDIELIDNNGYGELLFTFYDQSKMRFESISTDKARKFGKQIINRIKLWNTEY